jgi:hypothetical protein
LAPFVLISRGGGSTLGRQVVSRGGSTLGRQVVPIGFVIDVFFTPIVVLKLMVGFNRWCG